MKAALGGLRAVAEDLKDQRRPIQHFRVPRFFKIAVLHRGERAVDDHQPRAPLESVEALAKLRDLAPADQRRRARLNNGDDFRVEHVEIDRRREADRFFKPGLGRTLTDPAAQGGMNDNGGFPIGQGVCYSPSSPSQSDTGCWGMTVDMACL